MLFPGLFHINIYILMMMVYSTMVMLLCRIFFLNEFKENRLHPKFIMTAVFSVFLLTLVTPTAAANGTTTMSAGVPTIQVQEERRARRDALWLCRYMCVSATQRVLFGIQFPCGIFNQCVSHSR